MILLWCGRCEADDAADHQEAVSLLSGYFANFEAVESYDVFFKCESQWLGDDGHIEESEISARLIVDQKNNRCCSVMDQSVTKLVGSNDGAVEKRQVALQAVVFNGKETWARSLPHVASRIASASIVDVLWHNDSIYLPAIGVMRFPVSYSQAGDFNDQIEAIRYGAVPLKVTGKEVESLTVSYDISVKDIFTIRRFTVMDNINMKPISFYETAISPDGKVIPKVREKYQFTEKDGIHLPLEISGEKRNARTVGETRVTGSETYDVRFEWNSVNEPLDDELFSPQVLKDVEKIKDLVRLK